MQSERRSSIHCIDHPKTWKTLPGCEEYNQTADRIVRGFSTFEWPRGEGEEEEEGAEEEDKSPCPSLLASIDLSRTTSEDHIVNNPEPLTTTKKGGDGGAMTLSELLKAAATAAATIPQHKIDDPWLMQHLREAKARWSGSEPRYLDEVYGRVGARNLLWPSPAVNGEPSSPPRRDSQQSDMSGGSHPASIFKHALHHVKDGGSPDDSFELNLNNTTELLESNDDADSDVSELDLTEVNFR